MRSILVLSFILIFSPFASAGGQDGAGTVQVLEQSSTTGYSVSSGGDHNGFNESTDQSKTARFLQELGMDQAPPAPTNAISDTNATN